MKKRILSHVVLIFGLLIPVLGAAEPFSNIYVLGDSLSDQGNLYAATFPGVLPCPPTNPQCQALVQFNTGLPDKTYYYQGRFSNGPNYADILAQRLDLTLTPSNSGGNNFAYGGARTNYNRVEDTAPRAVPGPFPGGARPWSLDLERQAFEARNINDPDALFVVWSGSNDISDLLSAVATGRMTVSQAQAYMQTVVVPGIENVIDAFLAAGAQDILVPNIPDLGKVPLVPAAVGSLATLLASSYNGFLNTMLDTFAGVNIIRADVFSLIDDVAANPTKYGFTNVTAGCYSGYVEPDVTGNATVCSDPSTYAFWDGEHPTTAFHALLADRFYQAVVPEPPILMNFLLGLGVLAAVGRTVRRHRPVKCVSVA
ncbi:MAG: SGNH/GDSL hydrolase family protein [Candidatus Competibacteraceae bacterium]